MRKGWLTLGLIIIFIGLILSFFYNIPVYAESYKVKDTGYLELSVSANLEAGEHFFFNFSKGQYWTGVEEVFEPVLVGENYSIPEHKIVTFEIYCPSGDLVETEVYVVEGTMPFLVSYLNQTDDFTPLENGNLTVLARIEGIVNISGTYKIEAHSIVPPIFKTEKETLDIEEDPPRDMTLGTIETVETQPYFALLPVGIVLASSGAVLSVWATRAQRKLKTRSRKSRRR
jgi:hypothetical protein